jgi:hypothetical protein
MSQNITPVIGRQCLNISPADVEAEPYPNVIKHPFVEPDLYQRLVKDYPKDELFDKNSKLGGRAGRDLYRGDPAYDELMSTSSAWKSFNDYINSPAYVDLTLELFGKYLSQLSCLVEADKAKFCDYIEEREVLAENSRFARIRDTMVQKLSGSAGKNDLFVRLDLGQAAVGYGKSIHCDRPNRLTSMLIYFCDAEEIQMQGGELLIHEPLVKKNPREYERHPKEESVREVARLKARHNLGVFFLCCNSSYHSATAVTAQKGYRNFAYISVSSRTKSIW